MPNRIPQSTFYMLALFELSFLTWNVSFFFFVGETRMWLWPYLGTSSLTPGLYQKWWARALTSSSSQTSTALIGFNFEDSAMGGRGCLKAGKDLRGSCFLVVYAEWLEYWKQMKTYMYIYLSADPNLHSEYLYWYSVFSSWSGFFNCQSQFLSLNYVLILNWSNLYLTIKKGGWVWGVG